MKLLRIAFWLSSLILSQATAITVSGIVVNSTGNGVAGALVRLGKAGLFVQSSSEGTFTLTDVITGSGQQIKKPSSAFNCKVAADSRTLTFNLPVQSVIGIAVYQLNGGIAASLKQFVPCGRTVITLPHIAPGVHLFRISINDAVVIVKKSIDAGASGSFFSSAQPQSLSEAFQRRATAAIDDALLVSREGYYLSRLVIKNPDTSGIIIILKPWVASTVSDIDGNVYKTLKIGTQEWTTENFMGTRFNDGTTIPLVSSNSAWQNLVTPGYCFYNNSTNSDTNKKWGGLYNWYAVNTQKLAPTGWHVPSNAEWDTLQTFLIKNGYNFNGTTTGAQIVKSMASTIGWLSSDTLGLIGNNQSFNNSSGFRALPSGYRVANATFNGLNENALWWSATESSSTDAYLRDLYFNYPTLFKTGFSKKSGFSIRFVKD